jgi:aminopeptidase N
MDNAELAHQWFGNLVTMDWWNELWLNEGFATWVGWLAVDHFNPGKIPPKDLTRCMN